MSKEIRFKGIVATLAQIAADAFAGRISWASDLARPVHYYTDSDYAVLARKDVAETFPGVKITNQAGPVARMVQAGTDGTQSAVSAATARSTIGAMNRVPVTIDGQDLNTIVSNGLYQGDTVTNGPPSSGRGILRVYSANSDTGPLIWQAWSRSSYNGLAEFRRASNNSGSTWSVWVALSSDGHIEHPSITVAGVTRISAGGAGSLTTLATTGLATLAQATVSDLTTGRMVSTTTGGRLQALDAAGSRALLGVQTYLLVSSTKTAYALSTTPATIVSVPSTIGLANDETDFVCLEISGVMIAAKIATFTLDLGGTPMGSFTLPSCEGFDIKIRFSKALSAAETSIAFCGQTTGGALVQILSAATLWTTSKALTVTCAISTGTTTLYRTATAYKASQS